MLRTEVSQPKTVSRYAVSFVFLLTAYLYYVTCTKERSNGIGCLGEDGNSGEQFSRIFLSSVTFSTRSHHLAIRKQDSEVDTFCGPRFFVFSLILY